MGPELVFNELSGSQHALSAEEGRSWARMLSLTLREAVDAGCKPSLHILSSFFSLKLASNFTIMDWITESTPDREEKNYLLDLVTRAGYLDEPTHRIIANARNEVEVIYGGAGSPSLLAVHLSDSLTASFNSAPPWRATSILATRRAMDAQGNFVDAEISLRNAAIVGTVVSHTAWIHKRIAANVESGIHLWDRRADCLRWLEFSPSVKGQLASYGRGDLALAQVADRLMQMNAYCRAWEAEAGPFDRNRLPHCTPESVETLNNEAMAKAHTFRDQAGRWHLCSWHLRFTPGDGRIYFKPMDGRILVGHIGGHLPTRNYPNP